MATGGESYCDMCSGNADEHLLVTVLSTGSEVHYTVPSFPVFSAVLREIKYKFIDNNTIFDGYIRNCPNLIRPYPALLRLCSGFVYAFTIDSAEFERCISIDNKALCHELVFVIWKWKWEDISEHQSQSDNDRENNSDTEVDGDGGQENYPDCFQSSLVTHSVVFKCMGANKTKRSQEVLAETSEKLKKGEHVDVMLRREPTNPYDSKAIAFDCKSGEKWELIGYVAKEATGSVHHAMDNKQIISVRFDWIRYITHWSYSGVGWYCGIRITKTGEWPKEVVHCSL